MKKSVWGRFLCNDLRKLSIGWYLSLGLYAAGAHAANDPVGSVDGSFSVTPGGAATYTIPIKVPTGIGGIKPAISLTYNSQAGIGLLGVGWNMSGFSTITRCPQNLAQDGQIRGVKLDANDRFCLDGQRLVAVAGTYGQNNTEYRTEQDIFSKIISRGVLDNGPESFEVLTKDGLHMQFGDVAVDANGQYNSRFAPHGKEVVHIWAISSIIDNAGNVINFSYQFIGDDSSGTSSTTGYNREYYPSEVTYSGGGKLGFNYGAVGSETRPDPIVGYRAGGKVQTTKRLKKISVEIAGRLVRDYSTAYKPVDTSSNTSKISTITECGYDGQCLSATQIDWRSDQNGINQKWVGGSKTPLPPGVVFAYSDGKVNGVHFIDLDGDGVKDIIYHRWINESTAPVVGAYLYKNNAWQLAPSYYPPEPLVRDDEAHTGTEIVDINGDGLVDFVYSYQEDATTHNSAAYINNGTGWAKDTTGKFDPKYPLGRYDNENRISYFVDLNGDGLVDLVHKNSVLKNQCSPAALICPPPVLVLEEGAYFGTLAGWSGNQVSHIPPINFEHKTTYFWVPEIQNLPPQSTNLIDVNGDGLKDLLFDNGSEKGVYLKTSTGWGALPDSNYVLPIKLNGDGYGESGARFVDVNSDGLIDIVQNRHLAVTVPGGGGWLGQIAQVAADKAAAVAYKGAYLNTGKGWVQNDAYIPPQPIYINVDGVIKYTANKFEDINSDGFVDILFQRWDNNTQGAYLNTGTGWNRNDDYTSPSDLILSDGKNSGIQIIDANADGKVDILYSYEFSAGTSTNNVEHHFVNSITTGLGVSTNISYKPLTDRTVYARGTVGCQRPIHCVNSPMFVVGSHKVSNGIGGTAQYIYKYTDARVHSLGRGWLGFASRAITDVQTQQTTTTTYDNSTFDTTFNVFPFLSMPKKLTVSYADPVQGDIVTSETINNYAIKSVAGNPYYSVYLQNSTSEEKDLDGTPLKYTTTTTVMDDYGNATNITVDTQLTPSDATFAYRQTTTNIYDNDTANWHLGRLTASSVTSYEGTNSQTRNTAFAYYPAGHASAGMLQWTEDEPTDPDLYLKTEYTYDSYGNKSSVTVSGSASASYPVATRTTTNTFDYTDNQYPVVTTTVPVEGGITQSETKVYDARWGKLDNQTGPNGLTSRWTYDSFGRRSTETRPDATSTTWAYGWCDAIDTSCPTYAVYKVTMARSDGATSTAYMDEFSRQLRVETLGLDGVIVHQDKQYDGAGRLWRSSRPFFKDALTKYWTTNTFDAVSRVKTQTNPDGSVITNIYAGLQTTVTTERRSDGVTTNLSVRQIKNLSGKVEWVYDADNNGTRYTYLPFGELDTVTDPDDNVIDMDYDNRGRKTKLIDPDMGTWQYATDALGNLRWQKDAKNQETTMSYDLLNRMQTRVDVQNLADPTSVKKTSQWDYFTEADPVDSCRSIGKLKSSTDGAITKSFCYDSLGRIETATSNFDDASYTVATAYDLYSRVDTITYPAQDAGNQAAFIKRNVYDAFGHLKAVQNGATSDLFWTAELVNASGQITSESLGNGLTTLRGYDAQMGFLTSISTGAGLSSGVQSLAFGFDNLGNLTSRTDNNRIIALSGGTVQNGTVESFTYDAINRVSTVLRDDQQTAQYIYDALGNIIYNSEVGTYKYTGTRPHAVTEILRNTSPMGVIAGDVNGDGNITSLDTTLLARNLVGLDTTPLTSAADCNTDLTTDIHDAACISANIGQVTVENLTYDANGNMEMGISGKIITYTAFNKPETITKGANSTRFEYGADRSRYLQVATDASGTTKTHYLGQLFERTQKPNGIIEYKNYIFAGKRMVAVSTRRSNNTTELNYLHRDHINSTTVITDSAGIVKERFSYDVFGKRRSNASWKAASTQEAIILAALTSSVVHHGYTGHELLAGVDLIHMNGRVYDPELGRFLSADPFVQYKQNLQSFNRYSYVLNNPLSFTDPSGFFVHKDILNGITDFADDVAQGVKDFVDDVGDFLDENGRIIVAIGIASIPGVNVVAAGFLSSLIASGGDFRAAIIGGITAGAFAGVGDAALAGAWGSTSRVLAHGVVGGVSSVLNGGAFKAGFISAAVTQTASVKNVFGPAGVNPVQNAFKAALVGGTASVLAGGKFKNGAMTGAFSRMFNDAAHADYAQEEIKTLGSEMKPIGEVNVDRQTIWQKVTGFVADTISTVRPAFSSETIEIQYNKIDTVVVERTWYAGGTDAVIIVQEVGPQYQVTDMTGGSVAGYNYNGNGVYSRRVLSINGAQSSDVR